MREVQICATGSAPYSLKIYASPLAESMSFSIVIQLEAKRAAPSSLVGRLCASAAALAAAATMRRASVAGRAASKAAGWYTPLRSGGIGWQCRRLMSSAVEDALAAALAANANATVAAASDVHLPPRDENIKGLGLVAQEWDMV